MPPSGPFADRGPDRVSVLDVAVAAGVSHSLVLHYFKTYAELVRSVPARRNRAVFQQVKDRLARDAATGAAPSPMSCWSDPQRRRRAGPCALAGLGSAVGRRPAPQDGAEPRPQPVVDLAAARLSSLGEVGAAVPRDRVEEAILVAIAAVHGYATGKSVYLPALGQSDAAAVDLRFRRALGAMLRAFLSDAGAGTGAAD